MQRVHDSTPVTQATTRTEHPVRPYPPSSPQSFRRFARHLSPVTRHIIGPPHMAACAYVNIRPPRNPREIRAPFDACGPRNIPGGAPCATAPALFLTEFPPVRPTLIPCDPAHHRSVEQAATTTERHSGSSPALWTHRPPRPHRASDCFPGTYPPAANRQCIGITSRPKNKNGVFHVKHAAHFPPTAPPIKPFSSPTQGTFRSRVDSARVQPPALPAQIRPSPARSRSRRSVAQPAHSARSAASPHPYRATR
ncbi:hypothetical protein BLA15945_05013 [Burkholderia lata]|uniref:Uncharacterized protein n=1 Tax=Burkholderia lata (strain ATCC 17760 / DSM 23089 / LMG 22485 / NCIMB 9086 / R18194 / 383) TaxID=482957 RepID=A0A6P2P5M8_BURL3|nr:hypothetical protein BLA15945_05013 [Burkholderia lata]